jgi:hypothetical protein
MIGCIRLGSGFGGPERRFQRRSSPNHESDIGIMADRNMRKLHAARKGSAVGEVQRRLHGMCAESGVRKLDAGGWWAVLSRSGSYVLRLYPAEVEHYRAHRRIALGPGEQLLGEFASDVAARAAISQHFGQQARSCTASA